MLSCWASHAPRRSNSTSPALIATLLCAPPVSCARCLVYSPSLPVPHTCSNLGYTYDDLEQFEALAAAGNEEAVAGKVVALYPLEPMGERGGVQLRFCVLDGCRSWRGGHKVVAPYLLVPVGEWRGWDVIDVSVAARAGDIMDPPSCTPHGHRG